ncbi:MAG: hypothetical protein RL069_1027, partial [Planctomycetota bacterium]
SNPTREQGSDSTRSMASRDAHSNASSFTLRVTGPAAPVAGKPSGEPGPFTGGLASNRFQKSESPSDTQWALARWVLGIDRNPC